MNGWTWTSVLLGMLASASLMVSTPARAAEQECLRDTQCPGSELCIDAACSPGEVLLSCETDSQCPGFANRCLDGFCKYQGVVCRNPAGACWVENGSGQCECLDGNAAGWVDGYNPDDPPQELSDEELLPGCMQNLHEVCGESAPTLPEACAGEVLEHCEAYVQKEDLLLAACGEHVPRSPLARIGECCLSYEDAHAANYRNCVLAIDPQGCPSEALNACEDTDGSAFDGEGEQATGDSEPVNGKGCRVTRGAPPLFLILVVGHALWRRRRDDERRTGT